MPGQGNYGPWLVWANLEAWEDVLKPKNDLHLVFWSSAIQRHQKEHFINFSFNHTGWQSTVAKNEKISIENRSKFEKIIYTRVIYLKMKLRMCKIQKQREKKILRKKNIFCVLNFFPKGGPFYEFFFFSFTKDFENKFQKWVFQDHSDIARNKVKNFDGPSPYIVDVAHFVSIARAIMALSRH